MQKPFQDVGSLQTLRRAKHALGVVATKSSDRLLEEVGFPAHSVLRKDMGSTTAEALAERQAGFADAR